MMNLAYVNEQGQVGVCCDPILIPQYRREYTSKVIKPRELSLVLAGFCPRKLIVAVQVRRMLREDERFRAA